MATGLDNAVAINDPHHKVFGADADAAAISADEF